MWLYGRVVGELEQLRTARLRLRFTEDALSTYGFGARPLSLSLPLTDKRVQGDALERFCDNLLPEGTVRAVLEREHSIRPGDAFALLARIGGECAGAIQFTTGDDSVGNGRLTPLTEDDVDEIVRDLPTHQARDGLEVSASLGGIQDKVLLTQTGEGWAWPSAGAMSTHLIKPEPISTQVVVPQIIRYEHWALRLAADAGLPAASADLQTFAGREALVVERFDRRDGRRTHQEDFTQALGLAARDKYESSTGDHRLAALAARAAPEALDPGAFRSELLAQVTFNAAIGNGDAHSKNYSVRISRSANVSMTPLYDVAPVFLVAPRLRHAGHAVNEQVYLPDVTAEHLITEGKRWGLPAENATTVVRDTLLALVRSAERLGDPDVEIPVAEAVRDRALALLAPLS
ncbi:putative kinase Y4mE [Cellulomonas xylanilytica]|uniref:Putative kinase Y4mE n=2 Tax=Cellulomonas xylanilytica TaxID=233583 RepID=A0A510V4Z0_9CELL|nr:putative kinase Y4mE [Cellulomonas xylanilytica]